MQKSMSRLAFILILLPLHLFTYQPYREFKPVLFPEIGLQKETSDILCIDSSSTIYGTSADKCFLDRLDTKHPLSALYFGSSDFRLSKMFQNCYAATNTEFYNPYLRVLTLNPRVQMEEIGSALSLRIEASVGPKKWLHLGMRGSISFKRRLMQRTDPGWRGNANLQDVVSMAEIIVPGSSTSIPNATAYRLDLIEALPADATFAESITYDTLNGNTSVFGIPVNATISTSDGSNFIGGALVVKPESTIPRTADIGINTTPYGADGTEVDGYLPDVISNITENSIYEVPTGADYTGILDSSDKSTTVRIKDQDGKAQLWLIGTYTDGASSDSFNDIVALTNEKIAQYNQNVYEWFYDRGYQLETTTGEGIGDLRLEGYIASDFSDSFQFRINGGMVLPTARQTTTGKAPYAVHLGNRGHVEVFMGTGITVAIPKTRWFVTADFEYNTALSAYENICATPIGAQIKNMGPEVIAEISWHNAQGSVWLHMPHPKVSQLTLSVGYDWYSKIEDTVRFPSASAPSFLGNSFNLTTSKYTEPNSTTLDPNVAKSCTRAVAHTLRLCSSYTLSRYIKFSVHAGYVLGGRNYPQTTECGVSCTIAY